MSHLPLTPWKYGDPMDAWLYPHVAKKLEELIKRHDIRTVLEIGTCYGCSAIWFGKRVDRVYCIDTWGDIPEHGLFGTYEAFLENLRASGMRRGRLPGRVQWLAGDSHDRLTLGIAVPLSRYPQYDLVYLDGDHTYKGVKQDIEMYGPLAGKVLCGDDYDVDLPDVAGVIRAVDELLPERQTFGRFWWVEK